MRLIGEYRPPREVVAMGVARVNGRGTLTATTMGLQVEGRVTRAPPVSPGLLGAVGFALLSIGALVPGAEPVAVPLLIGGTLAGVWMAWRSEYGAAGRYDVPWAQVEHVVRLPADHDAVAILFSGPFAGPGSPEQVYFAPSNGVDALATALRDAAPDLPIDLESALREVLSPVDPD